MGCPGPSAGCQREDDCLFQQELTAPEKNPHNYSSFKLELLALVWAITKKFAEYLTGGVIKVFADNNPMAYLETTKLGPLDQRWAASLAWFMLKIHYRLGKLNGQADDLCCFPVENPGEDMDSKWEDIEIALSCLSQSLKTRKQTHKPRLWNCTGKRNG